MRCELSDNHGPGFQFAKQSSIRTTDADNDVSGLGQRIGTADDLAAVPGSIRMPGFGSGLRLNQQPMTRLDQLLCRGRIQCNAAARRVRFQQRCR